MYKICRVGQERIKNLLLSTIINGNKKWDESKSKKLGFLSLFLLQAKLLGNLIWTWRNPMQSRTCYILLLSSPRFPTYPMIFSNTHCVRHDHHHHLLHFYQQTQPIFSILICNTKFTLSTSCHSQTTLSKLVILPFVAPSDPIITVSTKWTTWPILSIVTIQHLTRRQLLFTLPPRRTTYLQLSPKRITADHNNKRI